MKRAALFLLVALTADAGGGRFDRFNSRCAGGRSSRGLGCDDLAFFEFAPASGTGMGTACACAAVTGAKGEALTFTRTGNATCSKQGLATTGIANGDLVVCANNNEPRVEPSGGVLGLRVESARTNEALRAEQWNNAAWLSANSGAAAATVTADQAIAPDGTTTAERIQIPATTSGQYSYIYQGGFSSVQRVSSFYVKGNGGSGSINLLNGSTPNACVRCNYVATSWTRCELASSGTASTFFFVGNDSSSAVCGTSDKTAVDAFVWGMQHEAGAYATSYIPTVAAAATRNAELARFSLSPATVAAGSMAVSVELMTTATNGLLSATAAGAFQQAILTFGGSRAYVGAVSKVGPLAALAAGSRRAAMWWDGSSTNLILDGSATAGAAGTPAATDALQIGNYDATTVTNEPGLYSRVCYDPSSSRCR